MEQAMKFTWTIEHFSKLKTKKLYSDVFTVGDYKWRMLIYPKGDKVDYLSMYLAVADYQTLPSGWTIDADFSLSLVDRIHGKYSIRKDTEQHFCEDASACGYPSFAPLSDLCDRSRGYLVDDTLIVEAEVSVSKAFCPLIPAITETSQRQEEAKNAEATMLPEANLDAKPALIVEDEVSVGKAHCPLIPAPTETSQPQDEAKNDEATMLPETNLDDKPALQDEMLSQLYKMKLKVETQKGASMRSVQDDGCSDVTLRRLSSVEELLKSTSEIPASAEALAALDTVKRIAGSSLATLCIDGSYEEFTASLTLLTEKGVIPLKIASMLKNLLQSLEGEIPNYLAAEKEIHQDGVEIAAQQEEIKTQVEMTMQKYHEINFSLTYYDAEVAELEAKLVVVKAKGAETTVNLKTAVDNMEPLRQRLADSASRSESFAVRQAMYGASLGTWGIVQDVLKNFLKF